MDRRTIKVVITGSTGMVGEGVLNECLRHSQVSEILLINRVSSGIVHPKLKEIIHADFEDLSPISSELLGYNTCFFCLGATSVGISKSAYYHIAYKIPMSFGSTMKALNPDMTFCYISGAGTDRSGKSRMGWARVKGKTETDLKNLAFYQFYALRPLFLTPTRGLKKAHGFYRYISWLFPIGRLIYPDGFCTLKELALTMIRLGYCGYQCDVLTGKNIIALAEADNRVFGF